MAVTRLGKSPSESFYVKRVATEPGPILLLGVGFGQLPMHLALLGRRVVAVEPSLALVQEALRRKSMASLPAERLQVLHGDLKTFRFPETFPVVLSPDNALGQLRSHEELGALLKTLSQNLEPGGSFLFDVNHPALLHNDRLHGAQNRPVFIPHLQERAIQKGSAPLHRLRGPAFSSDEWEAALVDAGLVIHERYGRFDGKPFDAGDALLVVVAQREGSTVSVHPEPVEGEQGSTGSP